MSRWRAVVFVAAAVTWIAEARSEQPDLAPLAFVRFCLDHPGECQREPAGNRVLSHTEELEHMLTAVNRDVNSAITPDRSKAARRANWSLFPARGDCNDFAISKRHRLLAAGLPPSALRLAVVQARHQALHLVLLIITSDSELVLDNLSDEVRSLGETRYPVLKVQSAADPQIWVAAARS